MRLIIGSAFVAYGPQNYSLRALRMQSLETNKRRNRRMMKKGSVEGESIG